MKYFFLKSTLLAITTKDSGKRQTILNYINSYVYLCAMKLVDFIKILDGDFINSNYYFILNVSFTSSKLTFVD